MSQNNLAADRMRRSIDRQEEQFKRENDPAYSLTRSKEEYETEIKSLFHLIGDHDFSNAAEFVQRLTRQTRRVQGALHSVQDDIDRISEQENPGWMGNGRRVFGRRVGRYPMDFTDDSEVVDDENDD